ncbi:hypothetical protein ACOZ7A_000031 [Yersinia enterocolitica]|uniref:ECs1072 family phage-associated protein n=1 Tax=Yersinia enterocolitica TaxID=630 RepID=UPI0005DDCFC7|nr:hypothetical protein [Yersinia enterocolitica]CQH11323.1 Uncharacterised protein [Yersinia enterocolitica]HDL7687508.1 hypothetical protein [Yersinia enterocolitica]HDL7789119.1 hypothetical protein [Yersinia enterocolitica]HDL8193882.1 hypothetical protein [Yersinia enterocolitica]HEI6703609.1 hypothetical protein [Yersinia enterocolitica]
MSGYSNLWYSIKNHINEVRGIKNVGYADANDSLKVDNRTMQIFILDVFLHEHRKKYGSGVFPLQGKNALHHKILMKYKWPLSVIREMSLNDSLFVLQDELILANLPEDAQKYLSHQEGTVQIAFDDLQEHEWKPTIAEIFLQVQER